MVQKHEKCVTHVTFVTFKKYKMNGLLLFLSENWISLAGAVIGLIYLYLEYKASIWMWPASIAMAVFYIYIFYDTQLYASMCIYAYFLFASVYGWLSWHFKNRDADTGQDIITRMPQKYLLHVVGSVLLVFIVIFMLLKHFAWNSYFITVGDAFTTSLNVVALWMASRKWADMWLLVIPANFLSSALLFVQHDVFSGILFFIFAVVSIAGFYNWKIMSQSR